MSQDILVACVLLAALLYGTVWSHIKTLKFRNEDLAADVDYKRKVYELEESLSEQLDYNERLSAQTACDRMERVVTNREMVEVLHAIKDNLEHRSIKN